MSRGAEGVVATIRQPCSRICRTASATPMSVTTGRWKMLPADARTAFPPNGSTDAPAKTTASAPAASADRTIVPALPGSWVSTQIATRRGVSRSAMRWRGCSARATTPCGVTVSDRDATASSETTRTGMPAVPTSSPYRPAADEPTKISRSAPAASPAATACGPSTRNSPRTRRTAGRRRRRAASTRAERGPTGGSEATEGRGTEVRGTAPSGNPLRLPGAAAGSPAGRLAPLRPAR